MTTFFNRMSELADEDVSELIMMANEKSQKFVGVLQKVCSSNILKLNDWLSFY